MLTTAHLILVITNAILATTAGMFAVLWFRGREAKPAIPEVDPDFLPDEDKEADRLDPRIDNWALRPRATT